MIVELKTCSPDFEEEHISPITLEEPAYVFTRKLDYPFGLDYNATLRKDYIYIKTNADKEDDARYSRNNHINQIGDQEITAHLAFSIAFCNNCGIYGNAVWKFVDSHLWDGQSIHAPSEADLCVTRKLNFDTKEYAQAIKPVLDRHKSIKNLCDEVNNEQKNFHLKQCPICGETLIHARHYSNSFYNLANIKSEETLRKARQNRFISQIQKEVETNDNETAKALSSDINTRCNMPAHLIAPANQLNAIKGNPDSLKKHLLILINLEAEIYSLTQRLQSLYYHRISAERSVVLAKHLPTKTIRDKTDRLIQHAEADYKRLKKQLQQLKNNPPKQSPPEKAEVHLPSVPEKPASPVLETPKLFNKKKVLAANAAKEKEYALALEKYEKDFELYLQKVKQLQEDAEREWEKLLEKHNIIKIEAQEQHKNKIKMAEQDVQSALEKLNRTKREAKEKIEQAKNISNPHALTVKSMIDSEIEYAEDLLRQMYKIRNSLYSLDIVFIKYRNIVALSSFYEYLMAGRVETLEGINGAYNIYESEVRLDTIIGQLDRVIESLEKIKENQYTIYSKLEEINSNLNSLNRTTEKMFSTLQSVEENTTTVAEDTAIIAQNTAVIKQNTAVIAHNSAVTAHDSAVVAHNSAVTAFYTKKNAELTNALGYMTALS